MTVTIDKLAKILQTLFTTEADTAAKESGMIQRRRKISGAGFTHYTQPARPRLAVQLVLWPAEPVAELQESRVAVQPVLARPAYRLPAERPDLQQRLAPFARSLVNGDVHARLGPRDVQ